MILVYYIFGMAVYVMMFVLLSPHLSEVVFNLMVIITRILQVGLVVVAIAVCRWLLFKKQGKDNANNNAYSNTSPNIISEWRGIGHSLCDKFSLVFKKMR